MCTVNGNIDAGSIGIDAKANSVVTVDGNVSGGDGDPDEVYFGDPHDCSDGGKGISASSKATVTVTGDAVNAQDASKVTVGGNAIGGSTNGNQGCGGCGVYLNIESGETGALTVGGQVKSGTGGEDGVSLPDLSVYDYEDGKLPAITMGACGSVGGYNDNPSGELTQDQLDAILAQIKITGLGKPEGVLVQYDLFWIQVVGQIRDAEPGSELTVDAGNRTSIPVYVLNAAAQRDITLIIKWNGGADIVVKNAVEVTGKTILLSELAKLVK